MSSMKSLVSLGLGIYLMNKIDLRPDTEEGAENAFKVQIAFGGFALVQALVLGFLFFFIGVKEDKTIVKVPKKSVPGGPPAAPGEVEEMTTTEYDRQELVALVQQSGMGLVITCGICYYLKTVSPMFIQLFSQSVQFLDHGLIQTYVFGKTQIPRPFKKESPFGSFGASQEESSPENLPSTHDSAAVDALKPAEEKKNE